MSCLLAALQVPTAVPPAPSPVSASDAACLSTLDFLLYPFRQGQGLTFPPFSLYYLSLAGDVAPLPLAGGLAAAVTTPLDVVKTRLQLAGFNPTAGPQAPALVRGIFRAEGLFVSAAPRSLSDLEPSLTNDKWADEAGFRGAAQSRSEASRW